MPVQPVVVQRIENANKGRVFTMIENQIVRQLQGIAAKLTADPDLQKSLMQEMFVHLVRIQTAEAGQPLSWYLKSCEFHARNYLKVGPGVDLVKRQRRVWRGCPHRRQWRSPQQRRDPRSHGRRP